MIEMHSIRVIQVVSILLLYFSSSSPPLHAVVCDSVENGEHDLAKYHGGYLFNHFSSLYIPDKHKVTLYESESGKDGGDPAATGVGPFYGPDALEDVGHPQKDEKPSNSKFINLNSLKLMTWATIKVESTTPEENARHMVKLCTENDFNGRCFRIKKGNYKNVMELPPYSSLLLSDEYKSFKRKFNIASMIVPNNLKVTTYTDLNFNGVLGGPYSGPLHFPHVGWYPVMSLKIESLLPATDEDEDSDEDKEDGGDGTGKKSVNHNPGTGGKLPDSGSFSTATAAYKNLDNQPVSENGPEEKQNKEPMTKTDSKTNLKNSNTETAGKIQQAGNQNSENFNHGITEPVENTNTTTTTGFTNSGHEGNRKDSENFNKWITEPVENTKTTTTTGFTNSEQEGNRKDSGKFNYGITETLENTKTTTTTGFTNSGQEGNRKENINELTPSINAVDLYLDKGSMDEDTMTKELIATGNGLLAQNTTLTNTDISDETGNQKSTTTPTNGKVVNEKASTNEIQALEQSTTHDAAELTKKTSANQDAVIVKSSTNHDVALKESANEITAMDSFITDDAKSTKQWNNQIRDQKFRELIKDERPLTTEPLAEDAAARRSNTKMTSQKMPFSAMLINRSKKPVQNAATIKSTTTQKTSRKQNKPLELSGIKKAIVLELKKTAEQLINGGGAYPYGGNIYRQQYG